MSIRLDVNNLSNKIDTNTYNKESHKVNSSFKSVIDEVKKGPFPLYEKKLKILILNSYQMLLVMLKKHGIQLGIVWIQEGEWNL